MQRGLTGMSKAGRTAVLAFTLGLGLKLLCMIRLFAFLRFFYTLEQKRCSTPEIIDLCFVIKPLGLKDSVVLTIFQFSLKSVSPHDSNRVGQEP